MLDRLRDFLEFVAAPAAGPSPDKGALVRVAVAALLVEIARADFDEQGAEDAAMAGLLARHFQLEAAEATALLEDARQAVDDAVSLRRFTAPLHAELPYAEKLEVVAMLWDVALEDRRLDKYEDYMIGKIAELLYVNRGDVIRLRHDAGLRHDSGLRHDASVRKNPAGT